jgi:hypothetical protein
MEENNVAQQEPVSNDTPVQESAPVQEVQTETVTETTNTEAPLQEEATETVEVKEPEYSGYDITQFMQNDVSEPEITADENGYIDPKDFYNKVLTAAEARIENKLRFQEAERKLWQSIENKYPEIREDSELRDILNAQRIADVASGGKGDLNKIAEKLLGKFQSYQAKGKVQAQVSEKVQKSAVLETNSNNNADTNKSADLMDRMSRGDQVARNELIAQWLADGKI